MNKITLIIQREYLTRVRKRSFLLTTFLVPIFFIAMYAGVLFLTKKSFEENHATVLVVDQQGSISQGLHNTKSLTYVFENRTLNSLISQTQELNTVILLIPEDFLDTKTVEVLSSKKANLQVQNEIKTQLSTLIQDHEYRKRGIEWSELKAIDTHVNIQSKEITDEGEAKSSNTEISMGIAMALSMVIYISLFLYGSQVMRGVIEEKSSRIIEVIISSVKPFQLMMGKITGIGLVGLTQFALWAILSFALFSIASVMLFDGQFTNELRDMDTNTLGATAGSQQLTLEIFKAIQGINLLEIILTFFIFFLGGYLIYSALFAAVGAAVDSETEASQFTMPITLPLLLTYMLSFGVLVNDPHGSIATWLSFIPFTSPIAMMVRIPFGVPTWQIILSAFLLIGGFIGTTWLAAKIYRTGILMHGKKTSFKELWKWLKYKN